MKKGQGPGTRDQGQRYAALIEEAKRHFKGARGSHGWDHVERVVCLAERIGRVEGADMAILLPAAILHDIGRKAEDDSKGKKDHAAIGAALAAKILAKARFGEGVKQRIIECIKSHRFRGGNKPASPEAKILFDADKLDSLGAVGVGRAFLFAGEVGARLVNTGRLADARSYSSEDTAYREYMVKLRKLPARMLTGAGKRLARERNVFMRDYFKQFLKEAKHGP